MHKITVFNTPAAWDAQTLLVDKSWIVHLKESHIAELINALDFFKLSTQKRGLTTQWLHGNMVPKPADFPLPTLAPLLFQARRDLEERYGLFLFRGFQTGNLGLKDLHLLHAGIAGYIGTPRPQTVFGEMIQDIRDVGQAPLKERRGSKHNRALPFHNDPCDVVSFMCIQPSNNGGESLFASSVAIHNAMLESVPEHVEILYQDFVHSYQDYLFVQTGWNKHLLPQQRTYSMPAFSVADGHFACKYSRFYIDQAQEFPEVPRLTEKQQAALDALEKAMSDKKWQLRLQYEPGDIMFINNYVCFHARTAFNDDAVEDKFRRHLLRIWLSMPNSRPLSPKWKQQVFFQHTGVGEIRGGVPVPGSEISIP